MSRPDLLLAKIGTLFQVATNVAHFFSPVEKPAKDTEERPADFGLDAGLSNKAA
jgi:hypothetical protein